MDATAQGKSALEFTDSPIVLTARNSAARHAPELDALRAVAILSVLVSHFLPADFVLNRWQGAAFGVPLFFALSGFLITRILCQSRSQIEDQATTTGHSLYIFYARRFLRIFPIYYGALFIGVALKYTNVRNALPWHLAYLSNFYYLHRGAFDRGPAPVFWTLSVEEQFYLIWPFVFFLLPIKRLAGFTLVLALTGCIFSAWASPKSPVFNTLLPAHLVYLSLGSYLGLAGVAPLGSAIKLKRAIQLFAIAMVACALGAVARSFSFFGFSALGRDSKWIQICRQSPAVFLHRCRSGAGVSGPLGSVICWQPIVFIGKISYGIYILQFFVVQLMDRGVLRLSAHIGLSKAQWILQSFPSRVAAIIAVASISWLYFEKPLNNLKRYFPYPR